MRLAPAFPRVSGRPAWLPHLARLLMALAVLVAVLAVLGNTNGRDHAQASAATHPAAAAPAHTVGVAQPGEVRAGGQLVLPYAGSSLAVFTRRPVEAVQVPVVKVTAHGLWIGSADAQVFVHAPDRPSGLAPGRAVDVTGWMVPADSEVSRDAGAPDDLARLAQQHQVIEADHVTVH